MVSAQTNTEYKKLLALFLSEVLRSRHTSVSRAAEISRHVVGCMDKLGGEAEVLGLISELERDFGEVVGLKAVLHFDYREGDVREYDHELKEFAASLAPRDPAAAAAFLAAASTRGCTVQEVCVQFPEFTDFLQHRQQSGEKVTAVYSPR